MLASFTQKEDCHVRSSILGGAHSCSRSRRLCGRLRLGGRLQDPEEGRLRRQHRSEPDTVAGDDVAATRLIIAQRKRARGAGRTLLRRSGHHRSRQRSKGRGARLHRRLRPGQGRVRGRRSSRTRRPGAPVPPILPPQDGYLFLDKAKFPASFAADVDAEKAAFMADSQVPWGVDALSGAISEPAWKTKPSWYLVATDDKMIPPAGAAFHVQARRLDSRRGRGQSRDLRVAAKGGAAIIESAAEGMKKS